MMIQIQKLSGSDSGSNMAARRVVRTITQPVPNVRQQNALEKMATPDTNTSPSFVNVLAGPEQNT